MDIMEELEQEFRQWSKVTGMNRTELGDVTFSEAYTWAGRMRCYLPLSRHEHVGNLAHVVLMRSGRKGISLDEFEQRLIDRFGKLEDPWKHIA
jgi:hypothetical protein